MPPSFSTPPALSRYGAVALSLLSLGIGSAAFMESRRDVSQTSYDKTAFVWTTGSGAGLTTSRRQIARLGVNGDLTLSGSLGIVRTSCDSVDTTATGMLVCGTDAGGGLTFATAENIYVNQAGDTMTGVLRVNLSTGFLGIRANQTISGASIHAETNVSSSGTIIWEGTGSGRALNLAGGNITVSTTGSWVWNENSYSLDARFEGDTVNALVFLDGSADRVGINTSAPDTRLDVVGTISGSLIHASQYSPRSLQIALFGTGVTAATGSGKAHLWIPQYMSGFNLSSAFLYCDVAGTTNVTSVQIRNPDKGSRKFFSTVLSIDSAEKKSTTAATPVVIDTTTDDVGAHDELVFDVPGVSTTAPKSCNVTLDFVAPSF